METRGTTATTTLPQAIPIPIIVVVTEVITLTGTLTLETGITTLAMVTVTTLATVTRTGDTHRDTVTQELLSILMATLSASTGQLDTVINPW